MGFWGLVLSLGTAGLWAASPLLLRLGMVGVAPDEVNPVRSLGFWGASAILLFALDPGSLIPPAPDRVGLPLFANVLLGNILGDVLYFAAIRQIGVSRAVAVSSSYPLVVTLISVLWLGERPSLLALAATGIIVAGLVLLRLEPRESEVHRRLPLRGYLCALAAALCWGLSIPLTKWLVTTGGFTPLGVNFWRSSLLVVLAWSIWLLQTRGRPDLRGQIRRVPLRSWAALAGAGAAGLALGGFAFALALTLAPASLVTPLTAASPLLTALVATLFLGDRLRPYQWGGIVLVALGSAAIGLS